jgi:molecular chaperone DnaK (HSP70)
LKSYQAGDTNLGGDDFDKVLVNWLMNDFKDKEGIDLIDDIQALQRLTEAAEKQKWNYLLLKNNYSLTIHYC